MTTILCLKHQGKTVMGGDGQVTIGSTVVKHQATKIRRLYDDQVLVGFAGASADAIALMERFEGVLKKYQGNVPRSAIELAKEWRTDKILRRLESLLVVADKENLLLVSGSGDVIEPDDNIIGIGSGGSYAVAVAKALTKHSNLTARQIVEEALQITAQICIYTNNQIKVEEL